ncbi:hypothetical protein C1646_759646 [Rhizophagus diaphanus]|nr:hypothetical protein C1646_759646 [Rhizophagus diaphanus] [Rhizophagus sp. MUCL 43196]
MTSSIITDIILDLLFDDIEKAGLLSFFTDRDVSKVEAVLSKITKDEIKVEYLRKYVKSNDKPLRCNEHPGPDRKRRCSEKFWKLHIAADNVSVKLPPIIISMLKSKEFKPNPRSDFNSLQNIQVRSEIMAMYLGQQLKHFGESYHGTSFFITKQMMDVWMKIDTIAYANGWLTLYIADASALITCNKMGAQMELCKCFFAFNQDILASADFGELTQLIIKDDLDRVVLSSCTSKIFSSLLKQKILQKALFVVDEYGALFNGTAPIPDHLNFEFLKNLNFWDEAMSGTHVVFTGMAHAKFEKVYLQNGMQKYIVYIVPLSLEVFDQLLNAVFSNLHLAVPEMIGTDSHTLDEVKVTLKSFEDTRQKQFYDIIKTYYNYLPTVSKNETRLALVKNRHIEQYYPICPATKEALMDLYKYCPLPQDYLLALTQDSMDGIQFEDAIFQQFM